MQLLLLKVYKQLHDTASNVDTHALVTKSGGSAKKISYEELNKATTNMVKGSLNLEASDVLSMQAGAANEITGLLVML